MQVMVVLITSEEFHESYWTNQEIGFAYARGIDVIPIKFSKEDPKGLIYSTQAWPANTETLEDLSDQIYQYLLGLDDFKKELRDGLINRFVKASSFDDVRSTFDIIFESYDNLIDSEINSIIKGYHENYVLNNSYYLRSYDRILRFLKKFTGKDYLIDKSRLIEIK